MSSNVSETFTELKPRPSRRLAWLLTGFHGLVVLVILFSVSFKPAAAALVLLTVLSWHHSYRLHVLHEGRRAVRRLVWRADGEWELEDRNGETHVARLLPSSYLHPRLLLLNFRLQQGKQRRNLLLLPDSLDSESLRRLRVRLRIEAAVEDKAGYNQA